MNDRFRGFLRGSFRLVLLGAALGALWLGWRAFLVHGPGRAPSPAMYRFHAKALVRHRLGFPRQVAPVLLPAPRSMSSADVQLRLMKWWDGRQWLPEALAHGEPAKGGLRLQAGRLELVEIASVSPAAAKDGVTTCSVRAKVRWEIPPGSQEILRVREIVGLRFSRGLLPGQAAEVACTFARKGWRWELASAKSPWEGELSQAKPSPGPMDWIF